MILGKKHIIIVIVVLFALHGCSKSSYEGSFIISGNIPPGISIENAKWRVSAEEVDSMGAQNLPIKPPKILSSWIQVSGTLVNCGTAAIGGVRLQMSVWEKSTNRSYPVERVIEREIKPSESIPLSGGYEPSFLGNGVIHAAQCDLKIEIIQSLNKTVQKPLINSLRNTTPKK